MVLVIYEAIATDAGQWSSQDVRAGIEHKVLPTLSSLEGRME